ncbi:MAG: Lrp/AsnC family transcriptional regulator [Christensenellales bacterium]|jgi:Lrp/AsnC family leucine-responsive transcriptional regulator|nr:Lrp/AsnC family transcriptional regulator [Christensenellaceae bacterium]
MQFDLTDRKIISILQKDGRITMKHLGELINMSTPSTIDRVRRLEEAGVIKGYAAVVDYIALGYDMHIYIFVEVNQNKRPGLLEYIAKNQLIAGAHGVAGSKDMVLDVYCRTSEFNKLVDELRSFGETESNMIMEFIKEEPIIPVESLSK